MKDHVRILCALLAALSCGCSKVVDKTTDTPTNKPAQAPYVQTPDSELTQRKALGPVTTTYCQPKEDGTYSYDTQMYGGDTTDGANGNYYYGEGGGCIGRPIRDAWGASMNQDLMVWTENGNSGTSVLSTPPAGVTRFFDVEYTHVEKGMGLKVKWNMTWYHTILAGTAQRPERILINYRRYKGTKFIKYWEGSIILTRVTDTITSIWIRNQIRATRVNEVNARGGATDIIAKIRRGDPATEFLP